INRHLKEIAHMIGISIPLTIYVARHSWASAARYKGVPMHIISESLGHSTEATTQIYLASLDTSEIDRANAMIISSL
ncbi:MAG: tyrosine-type recombinase/integrase, partial [Muribaculaceae bacterium]|nr:tyrosine-type recombinase/integrase [Muribaculaceae bacterium]